MAEKLQSDIIPRQPLGELALNAPEPEERDLFEVREEEIVALVPSVAEGKKTFQEFFSAINPHQAAEQSSESEMPDEDGQATPSAGDTKRFNRGQLRYGKSTYAGHIARIIHTGTHYLASFDDHEEGVKAGRIICPPDLDEALGGIYDNRIVPAATPLRHLRQLGQQAAAEVQALTGDNEASIAQRYTLLKALGITGGRGDGSDTPPKQESYSDLPANGILACLVAIGRHDIQRRLANDLHAGAFDHYIARDILQYIDQNEHIDSNFTKVRQLMTFLSSYLGNEQPDKAEFHDRMVRALDQWPPTQRQVISETGQLLLDRLQKNMARVTRVLKEEQLIGAENAEEAFNTSTTQLAEELLRRADPKGQHKAFIMSMRARVKRGRLPKRQRKQATETNEEETSAEERKDPLKLVTCNLNDYSITEGVDGVIDEFIRSASQGNITLRSDLERILSFMARTDLPPEHRRGVKAINGAMVRFGIDEDPDKLWNFFELKPSEAAGLSTKTAIAKSLRVYFIKMSNDTLGIIGIKARSEQDNFLRSIRVKTKQRG